MRRVLARLIPAAAKKAIRSRLRDAALRRAVARLRRMSDEQLTQMDVLREFRSAFGNESFSGDCRFLSEAASMTSRATSHVLECGSGASTIVVGLLAARRGVRLLSLEQDATWCAFIQRDLRRLGIDNVDVVYAPLRSFGEYDWYDIDKASVPKKLDFALCDGPAFCRGWRVGLLAVLTDRGVEIGQILCDDADDPHSAAMRQFWEERYGAKWQPMSGDDGALALVQPRPAGPRK